MGSLVVYQPLLRSFFLLFLLVSAFQLSSARTHGNSVSGISSGGFAAVQYHVSYSSSLIGVGVIAGGPFWCAEDNLSIATTSCMGYPSLISVTTLIAATTYAEALFSIDSTSNISGQKVWLYSGKKDTVVDTGVVQKLQSYYEYYDADIVGVYNISSEHAMITNRYGNPCSVLGTPFVDNCGFDAAGALLQHIYDSSLAQPVDSNNSNIFSINQAAYIPGNLPPATVGLYPTAYAYIPPGCQKTQCDVHISFHGCEQTINDIQYQYIQHAGFNEWAEANDIVILYPQAQANLLNPDGCWDWWGYTGADYATQLGIQMATVRGMQDSLSLLSKESVLGENIVS